MTTAIVAVTFDEMTRLAETVAKSGLFGMKTPEQALALMAIAQAEGQHPALAARDYHVVQGRPVLKSDAMLARFQAAGGRMKMQEYTDARVAAEFSHPQGGTIVVDWDIERAKRAGLAGKDNWKNYARQMLRARVISEGVRAVFPGAVVGMITPEEAQDIPEAGERDITPDKPLTGVALLKAKAAAAAPPAPAATVDTDTGEVLPPAEAVAADLDAVLKRIAGCDDEDALTTAADMARSLPPEQQIVARKAYRSRKQALSEATEAGVRG